MRVERFFAQFVDLLHQRVGVGVFHQDGGRLAAADSSVRRTSKRCSALARRWKSTIKPHLFHQDFGCKLVR
jgi:hypothetical protein